MRSEAAALTGPVQLVQALPCSWTDRQMTKIAPLEACRRVVQCSRGDQGQIGFGLWVTGVGVVLADKRPIAPRELPVQRKDSVPEGVLDLIQSSRIVEILLAQSFLQRPAVFIQAHQRFQTLADGLPNGVIERFERRENFAVRPVYLPQRHFLGFA